MNNSLAQLEQQIEQMVDAANQAHTAIEQFARAANGGSGNVIPGPTAYELLGSLSSTLWLLGEVTEFLPVGLRQSLKDPRITVVDRDFNTFEPRDPAAQIELATANLAQLHGLLQVAAAAADAAQTALNGQGWQEA